MTDERSVFWFNESTQINVSTLVQNARARYSIVMLYLFYSTLWREKNHKFCTSNKTVEFLAVFSSILQINHFTFDRSLKIKNIVQCFDNDIKLNSLKKRETRSTTLPNQKISNFFLFDSELQRLQLTKSRLKKNYELHFSI